MRDFLMFSGGIEREQWYEITEAAAQRCYLQNLLLKILLKSPEVTCEKTFSTKVAGQPATLLNKLPLQVFSGKFSEILKTLFLQNIYEGLLFEKNF